MAPSTYSTTLAVVNALVIISAVAFNTGLWLLQRRRTRRRYRSQYRSNCPARTAVSLTRLATLANLAGAAVSVPFSIGDVLSDHAWLFGAAACLVSVNVAFAYRVAILMTFVAMLAELFVNKFYPCLRRRIRLWYYCAAIAGAILLLLTAHAVTSATSNVYRLRSATEWSCDWLDIGSYKAAIGLVLTTLIIGAWYSAYAYLLFRPGPVQPRYEDGGTPRRRSDGEISLDTRREDSEAATEENGGNETGPELPRLPAPNWGASGLQEAGSIVLRRQAAPLPPLRYENKLVINYLPNTAHRLVSELAIADLLSLSANSDSLDFNQTMIDAPKDNLPKRPSSGTIGTSPDENIPVIELDRDLSLEAAQNKQGVQLNNHPVNSSTERWSASPGGDSGRSVVMQDGFRVLYGEEEKAVGRNVSETASGGRTARSECSVDEDGRGKCMTTCITPDVATVDDKPEGKVLRSEVESEFGWKASTLLTDNMAGRRMGDPQGGPLSARAEDESPAVPPGSGHGEKKELPTSLPPLQGRSTGMELTTPARGGAAEEAGTGEASTGETGGATHLTISLPAAAHDGVHLRTTDADAAAAAAATVPAVNVAAVRSPRGEAWPSRHGSVTPASIADSETEEMDGTAATRRVTILLGILFSTFIILTAPFALFSWRSAICTECGDQDERVYHALDTLANLHVSINPAIVLGFLKLYKNE